MVRIIRINAKVSPWGALRGRPASCIVLSSEYDNRSGEQESHWELNMLVGLLSLLSFFPHSLNLVCKWVSLSWSVFTAIIASFRSVAHLGTASLRPVSPCVLVSSISVPVACKCATKREVALYLFGKDTENLILEQCYILYNYHFNEAQSQCRLCFAVVIYGQ